ncbi:MAG TPA: hypothetical protein VLA12_01110 [Planctomycetaceae bacterium]|nr:hypothetical protein [Planctomycetaceae bacterium]
MKHAIHFTANMWPNQEHVSPQHLAELVKKVYPDCKIDWQAGDQLTIEKVEQLKSFGVPEMILDGARSYLGNRFVLTVRPLADVDAELSGLVETVHRELGDSLWFTMRPYDPRNLNALSAALASAIDFVYRLEYDDSFSVRIEPSPCKDPLKIARNRLPIPGGDEPEIQLREISEWESIFRRGLLKWLDQSNHKQKFNEFTRSFETLEDYATAAAADICNIAAPVRAWQIDVPEWSHQNALLLDQSDFYAYIDLGGVPKGIFSPSE